MALRILLVAVVGCGRLGFDASSAPISDAVGDVSACTSFGPWSAPVLLDQLSSPQIDYGGQVSGDGLTLYFDSNRDGSEDLFVATRPDRASPFGAPQKLLDLDTSAVESDPSPSRDGLELIFYQAADDCFLDARRSRTTDLWNVPTVTSICGNAGPFISRDGLTLYYNSNLDAIAEGVLAVTTRASTADPFTPGQPIAELMAGANKGYAALTRDELTMYFESYAGGSDLDLYEVTRASTSAAWGTPSRIPQLETATNDVDASITDDGTELYFASSAAGSPDLYVATRGCQ